MNSSWLTKFVEYILDNLFDILTVIAAAILVTYYSIKSPTQSDIPLLATFILALLGLIAVTSLWDRNRRLSRIEQLTKNSNEIAQLFLNRKFRASDFFLSENDLNIDFSSANTIYLSGIVLTRAIHSYMSILHQRFIMGAKIKLIILDPQKKTILEEFSLWSSKKNADAEHFSSLLNMNIQTVESIILGTPNVRVDQGEIQVGYLPFIPSFGLIFIDPDETCGVGYVKIYNHKTVRNEPTFELKKIEDPYWFNYFYDQYKILWDSCRIETLPRQNNMNKNN